VTFEGLFGDLFTVITLCTQPTRDLLAIAKFVIYGLLLFGKYYSCMTFSLWPKCMVFMSGP